MHVLYDNYNCDSVLFFKISKVLTKACVAVSVSRKRRQIKKYIGAKGYHPLENFNFAFSTNKVVWPAIYYSLTEITANLCNFYHSVGHKCSKLQIKKKKWKKKTPLQKWLELVTFRKTGPIILYQQRFIPWGA